MSLLDTFESKLSKRLVERVAETRSGRPDFYLSDWEVIDDHSARVLIGYNKRFGQPRSSQIDQWVSSTFVGQMRLALESLRSHHTVCDAVSGILVRQPELLPYKHSRSMIPVHANSDGTQRYQDDGGRIWEALADDNGHRYLVRIARDDIAAILEERQRKALAGSAHHRPRFAQLEEAGFLDYEEGDRITFLDSGIRQFGDVVAVGDDTVSVMSSGRTLNVKRGDVIDVVEKNPEARKRSQEEMIEIWTRMYGDRDFAIALQTGKNTGTK